MRKKIVEAIVNEYKGGKFLGLDELKSIIRIAFEVTEIEWTEDDFQWVVTEVLYGLH